MLADDPGFDPRSPASRVRLLRLLNGPIDLPVGSPAYEKRLVRRNILLRYEIGREPRRAVAAQLGLSLRQFHREHRAAREWVIAQLFASAPAPSDTLGDIFSIELVALERLAPALDLADARRRFEELLSCQSRPLSRVRAHLSFYEFLATRDDRGAVRAQRPALRTAIATIGDERDWSAAEARRCLVDAQIAWRDGFYAEALAVASDASVLAERLAETGVREHAVSLCNALQLVAQLRWETGGGQEALGSLNAAAGVILRHGLRTLPCAVTNAVGLADLLMRNAAKVNEAIGCAAAAFDQAALYGDAEDAATALLISAMAYAGQHRFGAASEHVGYALEFAPKLAPVGRTRLFAHAAEVLITCGLPARASPVLRQAESLVPAGSIADAQRQLRCALLTGVSGQPVNALALVDRGIANLEAKGATRFIGAGLKIRARIRATLGDHAAAASDLEQAVDYLRGESYAWTYAETLGDLGRATKNRALIREASVMKHAIGMR